MATTVGVESATHAPPNPAAQIDQLEQQLERLTASLSKRAAWAEAETLEHLALFEEAVQDLEGSANDAAARCEELLVAVRRLALEMRGLDLLAGHVRSVKELIRRLEAQVNETVAALTANQAVVAGAG